MKLHFFWMALCAVALLSAAAPRSRSILVRPTSGHAVSAVQPTSLAVTHRSGQTFITWSERADLAGERYRIYRHSQPITAASLPQAIRLFELAEGSSRFFANRHFDDLSGAWKARYLDRMVITDRGSQLPPGTGLLVLTLAAADLQGGTNGYYAVTTVDATGVENRADFTASNTAGLIAEAVADPLPVELAVDAGPRSHVFVQYMDFRRWNTTFHAPNESNSYYGFEDPTEPGVVNGMQYAYDYTIYEPDAESCGGSVPVRLPVLLILHPYGFNSYGPPTDAFDPWCALKIYPIDVSESWYFGWAQKHDDRQSSTVGAGDVVVNYTEQRLLRMLYDLGRHPTLRTRVDAGRVYVYGHSMGGNGALALAMRYPNVFAAAYAGQPTTNYRTRGTTGGIDWVADAALKWGGPKLNLPVQIDAPNGWATHLQAYNTMGVWDWQNHQANIQDRRGDEMVPLGIGHGLNDSVVTWSTQGRPTYPVLDASGRAWGGMITEDDHTWMEFKGLPPTLGLNDALVPFAGLRAIRQESVPGLSKASGNPSLPPAASGGYNQTLDWSASWNPWDGAPVDMVDEWRISLRTMDGSAQRVDVTPRRLQSFRVRRGSIYSWENRRASDNMLEASGSVAAESDGVVMVPDFAVSAGGNRLVLRPASPLEQYLLYVPSVLK